MIEWLDEFYSSPETQKLLEESFAPLFAEYGAAVAAVAGAEVGSTPAVTPFIQSIASTYITNYLSSSRAQMEEMLNAPDPRAAIERRLAEWAEKRPGKVAQEATVQTSNAVTQTVYKDAGVTRKKWNARGKSCPYCRRMNGKVVGIDRPFHKEGDSIEVPDSEISAKAKLNFTHEIGHPPQHQGCDCVIEADTRGMSESEAASRLAPIGIEPNPLSELDDVTRADVVTSIETMAARFPKVFSKMKGSISLEGREANEVASMSTTSAKYTLRLNGRFWKDRAHLLKTVSGASESGWLVGGTIESSIIHELAHMIDGFVTQSGSSLIRGLPGVSMYGAVSEAENFAEAVTALILTPKSTWNETTNVVARFLKARGIAPK